MSATCLICAYTCMCVCIHLEMYIHIYICIHIYIYIYIYEVYIQPYGLIALHPALRLGTPSFATTTCRRSQLKAVALETEPPPHWAGGGRDGEKRNRFAQNAHMVCIHTFRTI